MEKIVFSEETIQRLFGFEDAESETIERLKEYYFKNDTYNRVTAELPIRLLVGHKGTGKSALFKVAVSEDKERGKLPILIKPDDIAELGKGNENFLLKIRQWKVGLIRIIGQKVFNELGVHDETFISKLSLFGIKLLSHISDSVKAVKETIDLTPSQKMLIENFLKSNKIIVYIDDLDRGWEGKKDDITRISALLNSIRDLTNENPGLLFRLSLRSDVYYLVRTSDESTDKIEGSVVWCKWTNHEIFVLLIKRVQTFFGNSINEEVLMKTEQKHLAHYLDGIMERYFDGPGKWTHKPMYKILMSMTRKRPRDIVKLCSMAAHQAQYDNSSIIKSEHFQAIFEEYSQGRIQDTINEYKSELPNIEKLLFGMKPTRKEKNARKGFIYTTNDLKAKLANLLQNDSYVLKKGNKASVTELAQFLYKINFLTARKVLEDGEIQRRYFEENRYLSSSFIDFGYDWEIHPAFRWVLQPDNIKDIFNRLDL
ncbi:MAG: hypothetical protein IKQ03_06040 [Prevotella sp.]|nr:hypothetical protein [Prevotella sp.]